MLAPESETLRSSDPPADSETLSLLHNSREEEQEDEEDDEEGEDEDNLPCPHCGALMSFEYLYFPDTGLFSGTCTKCGGAPAPRSP